MVNSWYFWLIVWKEEIESYSVIQEENNVSDSRNVKIYDSSILQAKFDRIVTWLSVMGLDVIWDQF